MQIENRTFVVTGGGNGIGREVVRELLGRGARVAAADRDETALEDLAAAAGHHRERLTTHSVDVSRPDQVRQLRDAALRSHDMVDGLINVAGIIHRFVPLLELAVEEVERVMAVNFWGAFHVTRTFLPDLLQRPAACLVTVSSIGALVPPPGQGAYGASKAAVKALTDALQAELRGTGVAVSVVLPGAVLTDIMGNSGLTRNVPEGASDLPAITHPEEAGRVIVEAVESGAPRVLIGADAKGVDRLARLDPEAAIATVAEQTLAMR